MRYTQLTIFIMIMAMGGVTGLLFFFATSGKDSFIKLNKKYWACTKDHDFSTTIWVNAGQPKMPVMTPIKNTHTVCDQWSKK